MNTCTFVTSPAHTTGATDGRNPLWRKSPWVQIPPPPPALTRAFTAKSLVRGYFGDRTGVPSGPPREASGVF